MSCLFTCCTNLSGRCCCCSRCCCSRLCWWRWCWRWWCWRRRRWRRYDVKSAEKAVMRFTFLKFVTKTIESYKRHRFRNANKYIPWFCISIFSVRIWEATWNITFPKISKCFFSVVWKCHQTLFLMFDILRHRNFRKFSRKSSNVQNLLKLS